jgi:serine/threonine protein kinase
LERFGRCCQIRTLWDAACVSWLLMSTRIHVPTSPCRHLDSFGATATLVLQTQGLDSEQQERTKEVLSYLPPELAGGFLSGPTHLSDMYGLGATFWRLLTGRNLFFGPTVNSVLSSVASRDPPALHFIRPDVPIVLSRIVQKLLAKNPEDRYTSANGLKEDLLECNRHLGQGWESSEFGIELIKEFPLGRADHFSTFYLPNDLFGRESESKAVQRCIRDFVSRYSKRQRTFSSQASFASSDSFENTLSSAASTASTPSHAVSIMYPSAKRDLSDDTGMGMRMIVVRGSGG